MIHLAVVWLVGVTDQRFYQVLAVLRNNRSATLPQPPCKAMACSTDHGASFGPAFFDRGLLSSNCQSGVTSTPEWLAVSTPHGPVHAPCNFTVWITDARSAAANCRARASNDWRPLASLWPGPSAYSSLAHVPSRRALVVAFERGHVTECGKGGEIAMLYRSAALPSR